MLKINVVLIRGFNDDELVDFVNMAKELPIAVRFIEFMPFDGNKWDLQKMVSYAEIREQLNAYFSEKNIVYEKKISLMNLSFMSNNFMFFSGRLGYKCCLKCFFYRTNINVF